LQQEEFHKLIKNWESFDQLKFYEVFENLENLENLFVIFGELWNSVMSWLWLGIYTSA
jgi:hypothetical protein